MKKIILSIVGVVGLAVFAQAQYGITNLVVTNSSGKIYDFGGNDWIVDGADYGNPSLVRWVTNPIAGGYERITQSLILHPGGVEVVTVSIDYADNGDELSGRRFSDGYFSTDGSRGYGNGNTNSLNGSLVFAGGNGNPWVGPSTISSVFSSETAALLRSYGIPVAEPQSYQPSTSGDEPDGGGGTGGVMASAEQLNIGLTFQNGQWTPAQ